MTLRNLVVGVAAGTVATVPMTLAMLAFYRFLPLDEQYTLPQGEIVEALTGQMGTHDDSDAARLPHPEPEHGPVLTFLGTAAHFGYGAACGAAYSAITQGRCPRPLMCGVFFGLPLWSVSYLGWLPALGILTPATCHPLRRNAMMLAVHFLWGPVTALLVRRWAEG